METSDLADKIYLVVLLLVNSIAFLVILACYVQIYFSLDYETRRGSSTMGGLARGEMNVAKKMALLVFTDLACWAPIAFFALTAVAGYPLIDVTRSKILLVFFYPLNSCANPFLYAILTSQYRRDLFLLLDRCGMCTSTALKYKREAAGSNNAPVRSVTSVPMTLAQRQELANISIEQNDLQSPTLIKQCIILQQGDKCTVCVIGNQQETFL
jgi:thyroid stimulating hormone receptor